MVRYGTGSHDVRLDVEVRRAGDKNRLCQYSKGDHRSSHVVATRLDGKNLYSRGWHRGSSRWPGVIASERSEDHLAYIAYYVS